MIAFNLTEDACVRGTLAAIFGLPDGVVDGEPFRDFIFDFIDDPSAHVETWADSEAAAHAVDIIADGVPEIHSIEGAFAFARNLAAGRRFTSTESDGPSTWTEMVDANREDEDVLAALRTLKVGETADFGPHGGSITRVS